VSAPLAGGSTTTLGTTAADGTITGGAIVVDDTSVYWVTHANGTVLKVARTGGPVTTLASGQVYPVGIAVDEHSIYWTSNTGLTKLTPK
jgi:sugar lactone lactonase YvrE